MRDRFVEILWIGDGVLMKIDLQRLRPRIPILTELVMDFWWRWWISNIVMFKGVLRSSSSGQVLGKWCNPNFFSVLFFGYKWCGGKNLSLCVRLEPYSLIIRCPMRRRHGKELVIDKRVDKYPRVLVREGHPPRIWHMSAKWASSYPRPPSRKLQWRR